jgi:hypothetical protein
LTFIVATVIYVNHCDRHQNIGDHDVRVRKSWSFGWATISTSPTEAFGWPAWKMRLTSSSEARPC